MLPGYCHAVHSKTSGKTSQEGGLNSWWGLPAPRSGQDVVQECRAVPNPGTSPQVSSQAGRQRGHIQACQSGACCPSGAKEFLLLMTAGAPARKKTLQRNRFDTNISARTNFSTCLIKRTGQESSTLSHFSLSG